MRKISLSKTILPILIGSNIVLSGCSITSDLTDEKGEDSNSSSYSVSSNEVQDSNFEASQKIKAEIDKYLEQRNNNLMSIEESSKIPESEISEETSVESIEPESEISEETSVESIEPESEISEETSVESIEPESEILEETSVESIEPESEILEETSVESKEPESSIEEEVNLEDSKLESIIEEINEISESEVSNIEVYTDDNNYIRANEDVNLRSEPNTNSYIFSILYKGNTLKKIGYVGNWYIVDYNGNNAYVSADYTDEIEEKDIIVNLNKSNMCYFPYGATLYSNQKLTDEIMDIPALECGQILEQVGNAFQVNVYGQNGYVSIQSLTIIPQPLIVVDKSDQTLSLYKNNQKQMEFSVVTGNENPDFYHPTGEGLFDIYSKSYDAELVGDTWDVVVNVFMGFNGGEGIHDAVWRSYFGGDIYTYDGSHGCINCPYNEVMELASEVEVGDKVLVKR